jgi:hypothetical protein
VVTNVQERLLVNKWAEKKCDIEIFNLKHLNKYSIKLKFQICLLENLDDNTDISKNIEISAKQNLGYYQLKQQIMIC